MSIYIIDEIMGRGKTSAMLNFINQQDASRRFVFVTPYLSEVERVIASCPQKNFKEPAEGNKLKSVKKLFQEGANIATTHALFSMFTPEILDLVRQQGYIMVMDEVTTAIRKMEVTSYDAQTILSRYAEVTDDGQILWKENGYAGKLDDYRRQLKAKDVKYYNDYFWIDIMNEAMFSSFRDVYIMTYLFEHQFQRCYFDLKGIRYKRKYVCGDSLETYNLSDYPSPPQPLDYKSLIHIVDNKKLNQVGEPYKALSKSWYIRSSQTGQMAVIRNNLYNFFRNIASVPSSKTMWTVFKKDSETKIDWQNILAGKGYTKGFVSCNSKGTNAFRDRTALAYMINCFPNTSVRNFLIRQGVRLDQDGYALSEMVQWIWRSAIRDGKEINIYIPSRRMRTLLINWLDDISKGG